MNNQKSLVFVNCGSFTTANTFTVDTVPTTNTSFKPFDFIGVRGTRLVIRKWYVSSIARKLSIFLEQRQPPNKNVFRGIEKFMRFFLEEKT